MPKANNLKVASLQMVSTSDLDTNLQTATDLIKQAADQGCSVAVLPEYFCLFGKRDTDKLAIQETFGSGKLQDALAEIAQKNQIHIVAGTIPISSEDPNRVWNSSLVYSPSGKVIARYDKIHLFSFSQGSESYDESKTLFAGNTPVTFEITENQTTWRFGMSICYDIRFPELYRSIGEVDCQIIPAAFTYTTGKDHWEILLRSRAIENQCYFIASAQGGTHDNGRRTWGNSMIINPWGAIESVLSEGPGIVIGELSKDLLNDVRSKLPALKHRKQ